MEHVVGGAGTVLVLVAYFLVSAGKIPSQSLAFQGMNLLGALLLTVYGFLLFAWATVALNAVWGVIALLALLRIAGGGRRGATEDGTQVAPTGERA